MQTAAVIPATRIDREPYYLPVHDEIAHERETAKVSIREFEKIMLRNPAWAKDCPMKVKVVSDFRYRKA
jgi:hypothetical protein